jgi:hypothetical protein
VERPLLEITGIDLDQRFRPVTAGIVLFLDFFSDIMCRYFAETARKNRIFIDDFIAKGENVLHFFSSFDFLEIQEGCLAGLTQTVFC